MVLRHICIFTTLTVIPVILEFLLKKRYKNRIAETSRIEKYKYSCTFTSATTWECRGHIFNNITCSDTCSRNLLFAIVNFIECATNSVSMCIYTLTSYEISSALVRCHHRGIRVRIVLDEEMASSSGSKIKTFQRHKIPVKTQQRDGSLMHHKFCLRDENTSSAEMFVGTLNLTLQGICSNFDTIIFTDNIQMIKRFSEEYEELWSAFDYLVK